VHSNIEQDYVFGQVIIDIDGNQVDFYSFNDWTNISFEVPQGWHTINWYVWNSSDHSGLMYWISRVESDLGLTEVANTFAASEEF
jgi:hypothetical protein